MQSNHILTQPQAFYFLLEPQLLVLSFAILFLYLASGLRTNVRKHWILKSSVLFLILPPLIAVIELLFLPVDPTNEFLFGYSADRIILVTGLVLIVIILIWCLRWLFRNQATRLVEAIDHFLAKKYGTKIIRDFLWIILAGGVLFQLLMLRNSTPEHAALFVRLTPLIGFVFAEVAIAQVTLSAWQAQLKTIREYLALIPEIVSRAKKACQTWFTITVVGLSFILVSALGGLIQNYFNGEEFVIYFFANKLPFQEAWQAFFHNFGRPIEAIYWTYQYKLIGFNPLLAHSLSFVLLLLMAMLAAACFLNSWPQSKRSKLLPYLLVFSLFVNWVCTSTVFRLSYDNGRISMIFFFLAGLALQRWAITQRTRWLLFSYALFLMSIFSYENAAFLFPALLLLAWPLLPPDKKYPIRKSALIFTGLAVLGELILFVPYVFYDYIFHSSRIGLPAMNMELDTLPTYLFDAGKTIYLRFGQFGDFGTGPLNFAMIFALISILAFPFVLIVRVKRDGSYRDSFEMKSRWVCIYLASLWFLILGPLPYVLLGYDAGSRVYSSAVFGVFPLTFMIYESANRRLLRLVGLAFILLFSVFGFFEIRQESISFNQLEPELNTFYRKLKDAVPYVESDTVFVFINGGSIDGCGPSLQMLYNQDHLKCAILKSTRSTFVSIRHYSEIENNGQHLSDENLILVLVKENVSRVIPTVYPGDFDLLVTWESEEPLATNYTRIITEDLPPPSSFYMHLLIRQKELNLP